MKKLLIASLLMMLVSAGCETTSQPRYPLDWPQKKASTSQCPDISGIYYDIAIASQSYSLTEQQSQNVDDESSKKKTNVCSIETISGSSNINHRYKVDRMCSLNSWLDKLPAGSVYLYLCPLKTMKIEQPDDNTINITNYENEEVIKKHTLGAKVGDFICQGGKIIFNAEGGADSAPYSYLFQSLKREMFAAEDGSLVSNVTLSARGIIVVIPIYENYSIWFRWRKVDDTNMQFNDMVKMCK